MTQSTNELREAAKRRRKPYPRASVSGGKDYDSYYVHQQEWADLNKLADAFCDEHPSDDDTPIDEEWLLAVGFHEKGGFRNEKCFWINEFIYVAMFAVPGGWSVRLGCGRSHRNSPTRGQLRRLCEVLGIQLTEGK